VREELARHPGQTGLLADNFKVGSELGFALGDDAIPVLDHPLNIKHGRAPQLRLWDLERNGTSPTAQLLGGPRCPVLPQLHFHRSQKRARLLWMVSGLLSLCFPFSCASERSKASKTSARRAAGELLRRFCLLPHHLTASVGVKFHPQCGELFRGMEQLPELWQ